MSQDKIFEPLLSVNTVIDFKCIYFLKEESIKIVFFFQKHPIKFNQLARPNQMNWMNNMAKGNKGMKPHMANNIRMPEMNSNSMGSCMVGFMQIEFCYNFYSFIPCSYHYKCPPHGRLFQK